MLSHSIISINFFHPPQEAEFIRNRIPILQSDKLRCKRLNGMYRIKLQREEPPQGTG